jgi:hypothetical protein
MKEFLQLNDFNVPGYDLNVSGELEIRTEDISGETSSTSRVEKGVKPKRLNVSVNIQHKHKNDLTRLISVLEARGKHGEGKVYNITNRDANVSGIKQVRVTDRVSWKPISGLRAWNVTFTLREYLSVPEKVEQREKKPEKVAQKSEGKPVEAKKEEQPAQTAEATKEPQTGFEKFLYGLDRMLA